jgi:tRNA pseudouridine38-40 synthase
MAVHSVESARPDFHPRYDALARCYRYQIFCSALRDPLRERYAWRVSLPVDMQRLRKAAAHLPGSHDFGAFGAPTRPGGTTIRDVFRAVWQEEEAGLAFEIEANAFLYHMVRRLVSLQVAIGQGALEASAVLEYLEGGSSAPVQGLAPPQGLALARVVYPVLEREEPGSEKT